MRRPAALASIALATTLLLAGCSGDGSDDDASASPSASASSSAADAAALAAVEVTGDAGAAPTLTFDQPFTVSDEVARVVTPGTGEQIADGQLVTLNIAAVSGEDGSDLGGTYGTTPEAYLLTSTGVPAALRESLVGQTVGTRVLYAAPSDDSGTMIWAIEVASAQSYPTRADGAAVAPVDGLPVVTLADDGEPTITAVAGDAPTSLVAQQLITGTGPAVEADQTLVVQYSGWLWDGTAFDSSWSTGDAFLTPLGSVVEGWQQGLAGQPVGSQVLLVIPPDLGYGDTATGSIPAGSTLVFVVDILAAV